MCDLNHRILLSLSVELNCSLAKVYVVTLYDITSQCITRFVVIMNNWVCCRSLVLSCLSRWWWSQVNYSKRTTVHCLIEWVTLTLNSLTFRCRNCSIVFVVFVVLINDGSVDRRPAGGGVESHRDFRDIIFQTLILIDRKSVV